MAGVVETYSASEDELPDLVTILAPRKDTTQLRRLPRKAPSCTVPPVRGAVPVGTSVGETSSNKNSTLSSAKWSPLKTSTCSIKGAVTLGNVPILSRHHSTTAASATSNNRAISPPKQRSLKLTHVDSLLLPLSQIALKDANKDYSPRRQGKRAQDKPDIKSITSVPGMPKERTVQKRNKQEQKRIDRPSRFVLQEARCKDDPEDSGVDEDTDEETDLSGFIVADDAEISIHDSNDGTDSDSDAPRAGRREKHAYSTRGRAASVSFGVGSDKDESLGHDLIKGFTKVRISSTLPRDSNDKVEVIDLVSSPTSSPPSSVGHAQATECERGTQDVRQKSAESSKPYDNFDAFLKFFPPHEGGPTNVPMKSNLDMRMKTPEEGSGDGLEQVQRGRGFTTPPATPPPSPPRSPTKLKSPCKGLSPSKNTSTIPQSPHRQSLDAFWDLDVINTWNDTCSPKKAPMTSPRKTLKERFLIWSDSENDEETCGNTGANDSSDSLPSPCSSPRKVDSPIKGAKNAEKMRLAAAKKAIVAEKKKFDSIKQQLANDLLRELDVNITNSMLTTLCTSTGGVDIVWSNNLRSTAGRANWKRTFLKPSGSPMKSTSTAAEMVPGAQIQHQASIELAAKVIDCESRLANTVAHEFCHLANFMVSGIRDKPHGTSFKVWADKVTKHLRTHQNTVYRSVQVTTKHSYKIEHKYIWICIGRQQSEAMKFLNFQEDEGCGAEYGRHSKSINVDVQRCGRCKGKLIQVKPTPRKSPVKRSSPRKALFVKKVEQEDKLDRLSSLDKEVDCVDLGD